MPLSRGPRLICMVWLAICVSLPGPTAHAKDTPPAQAPVAIAIHGGAGTLKPADFTPAKRQLYVRKLSEAVQAGHAVLLEQGTSIDAVIAAITVLEQSPLFNAGIGAVYTWDATHELDASIMSGADLTAGAVAGVKTVASPIRLAAAVMRHSPHVLLSGTGAEAFARTMGMPAVDNHIFDTPSRLQALQRAKAREQADSGSATETPHKWGTVGAVALDAQGNLAAGTSTGGMTGKRWGRIGDSPLIGAGTYADNRSCAVSATGHGEFFIRYNVAANICARVRLGNETIAAAGQHVLFNELLPAGGTGGVIIMNPQGEMAMPFNTAGMYRASINTAGQLFVGIHR